MLRSANSYFYKFSSLHSLLHGGGGYAGLDVNCASNGFSLYVVGWHEYTDGLSAEEYMPKRREGWNLNAKGASFGPNEEFLLKYLGLCRGMTGDTQLVCPERHPTPHYRDCVSLVPRQERKNYKRRRLDGYKVAGHEMAKFVGEQKCKTLLCTRCDRRYPTASLTIDAIIEPDCQIWTKETKRKVCHQEWERGAM